MILDCTITCPKCGFKKEVTMPAAGFETAYPCAGCGAVLTPQAGDCCVFCSYGSVICPSMQERRDCCSG